MASLPRPIPAAALFATPEMSLRFHGEVEVDRRGADEGEGSGFDNMDMSASAERILVPGEKWEDVLLRCREQFRSLGWQETYVDRDVCQFRRDVDESAQVQLLPMQEHWSKHYGRSGRLSASTSRLPPLNTLTRRHRPIAECAGYGAGAPPSHPLPLVIEGPSATDVPVLAPVDGRRRDRPARGRRPPKK